MSRKPRADAKLKTLPDALQERLYQELRRTSQAKVIAWLKTDHEIETSAGALTDFFTWYPRTQSLRHAATFADQFVAQASKLPEFAGNVSELQRAAEVLFQIQAAQDRDPKLFVELMKISLAKKDQELNERKVKLLEAKAALADQAKEVTDAKDLTPEEQLKRYRQIFGG